MNKKFLDKYERGFEIYLTYKGKLSVSAVNSVEPIWPLLNVNLSSILDLSSQVLLLQLSYL